MPVDPLLLSIGERMVEKRLARAHEQTLITQHTRLINMTAICFLFVCRPSEFRPLPQTKADKNHDDSPIVDATTDSVFIFFTIDPATSFWPDQSIRAKYRAVRDCFVLSMRRKARALLFISTALSCSSFCLALYGTRGVPVTSRVCNSTQR